MKKLVLLVVLFVALSATACDSLPGMKSQPATTTPTTLPTSAPVATATKVVPATSTAVAPATATPTTVFLTVSTATPVFAPTNVPELTKASEVVNELCDGALIANLSDPNRTSAFELPPMYGANISVDPGKVTVSGKLLIASDKGMLLALHNSSAFTATIEIVTGWNLPNARWNIHACDWIFTLDETFARAKQWQGEPGSVSGEHKPVFRMWAMVKDGIKEVSSGSVPAGSESAKTVCNSSGAWKGDLQIPAGCVVWVSGDPGYGIVSGVPFSSTTRWTLVAYGPAQMSIKSPTSDKINHWMGPNGVVDTNARDGAPTALLFKDGKIVNRP